jgi:hypothetical protein
MITHSADTFPEALYVSGSSIEPYLAESWAEIEDDPRGVLFLWEPPSKSARYIMGMDPTEGITGWSRAIRAESDRKTDNGVIEIFKVDGDFDLLFKDYRGTRIPDVDPRTNKQKRLWKDVQVAEFAAPVDAVEIARIAHLLGKIYAGEEEDQCELIYEAWPGPGLLTTQELIRLGYSNVWMWEHIDSVVEQTNSMGWHSTPTSQRLLWYRARRHMLAGQVVVRSKWLLDELSSAEIDQTKMRAKASYGAHDDRMQAASMCYWAGHRWAYDSSPDQAQVTDTIEQRDYQRIAPDLNSYQSYSDWKAAQIAALED